MAADPSAYLPVTADDANRQQNAARTFYLLGDFFKGVDNVRRMEPGNVNDTGLLGPSQPSADVGVGNGGELFIRGQAGQVGTTNTAPPRTGLAAITGGMNPLVLVAGAVGLFLAARWLMKR